MGQVKQLLYCFSAFGIAMAFNGWLSMMRRDCFPPVLKVDVDISGTEVLQDAFFSDLLSNSAILRSVS